MNNEIPVKSYSEKIEQEAEYWGGFEEESLQYGIPWWVDLRRAETTIKPQEKVWFYDPGKEKILRGKEKTYLITNASRTKGRALDLGCGAGWLCLELARNGMFVDGIDVSPRRIEIARRFLEENPFTDGFGGVNYMVADLNHINLEANAYDSVIVWDSLHHIQNLDLLMGEVEKSLKPGGELLVYDHIGRGSTPVEKSYRLSRRFLKGLLINGGGQRFEEAASTAHPAAGGSPFEDVSGRDMIEVIERHFRIRVVRFRLSPLIMKATQKIEYCGFLSLLSDLDRFVCNMRLLSGEYILIHASR